MIAIVLKYRKSFLIILLLYILWIVRYYRDYCLELYKIGENRKVLVLELISN